MKRKKRKNGPGSAVGGFLLGAIFPPLGLGSVFAGYRPGTFWSGATWGGAVAGGLLVLGWAVGAIKPPSLGPSLGSRVQVGQAFTALVDTRASTPPGAAALNFGGSLHMVATSIGSSSITAAVADAGFPSLSGRQVIVPFESVTAIG